MHRKNAFLPGPWVRSENHKFCTVYALETYAYERAEVEYLSNKYLFESLLGDRDS